ncbi:MAG: hypothetical protein MJE68_33670, partial [Proteobacteria bacterium]|nr:hypothetical protein [Pseudomonadota bacterium]
MEKGCRCKRNKGKPCSSLFSRDHYDSMRMQCRELSRDELDLVLLGQIAALLANNSDTIAPNFLPRQCFSMAFLNHAQLVGTQDGQVLAPTYDWAEFFDA